MVVVTAENASGKSLLVRSLGVRMRQPLTGTDADRPGTNNGDETRRPTVISPSIRERTEFSIKRAFMYGGERDRSTGATSACTVRAAIEHNLDRPEGALTAAASSHGATSSPVQ
ncbi:hypothetical protein GCM10027270_13680 [Nocardioides ginkgobilobae]